MNEFDHLNVLMAGDAEKRKKAFITLADKIKISQNPADFRELYRYLVRNSRVRNDFELYKSLGIIDMHFEHLNGKNAVVIWHGMAAICQLIIDDPPRLEYFKQRKFHGKVKKLMRNENGYVARLALYTFEQIYPRERVARNDTVTMVLQNRKHYDMIGNMYLKRFVSLQEPKNPVDVAREMGYIPPPHVRFEEQYDWFDIYNNGLLLGVTETANDKETNPAIGYPMFVPIQIVAEQVEPNLNQPPEQEEQVHEPLRNQDDPNDNVPDEESDQSEDDQEDDQDDEVEDSGDETSEDFNELDQEEIEDIVEIEVPLPQPQQQQQQQQPPQPPQAPQQLEQNRRAAIHELYVHQLLEFVRNDFQDGDEIIEVVLENGNPILEVINDQDGAAEQAAPPPIQLPPYVPEPPADLLPPPRPRVHHEYLQVHNRPGPDIVANDLNFDSEEDSD